MHVKGGDQFILIISFQLEGINNKSLIVYKSEETMDEQYTNEEEGQDEIEGQYDDQQYVEESWDYDLGMQRQASQVNAQYQMGELQTRIIKETAQIEQLLNIGFDWSILLYYKSGWNKQLVQEMMLSSKHKQFINYTQNCVQSGKCWTGLCELCFQQNQTLMTNICGHSFCIECWKGHILHRLNTDFLDPFPPCIMDDNICKVKVSYSMFVSLSEFDPKIKQKFTQVLCRSYATMSKNVKMCKGREGVSCNNCFTINKLFDVIQCENCGSLVCPRCGERSHGSTECYIIRNWKKLTEESLQFVEIFNYKFCPNCKEAVERSQGCNSMICKCKTQFCFVCGQKWLPNHKLHGDKACPKFQQIEELDKQKKKLKDNKKKFFQTIQQKKSQLQPLLNQNKTIQNIINNQMQSIIQTFLAKFHFHKSQLIGLKDLCSFVMKGNLFLFGQIISFHFNPDEKKEYLCQMIKKNINLISNFLISDVQKLYLLFHRELKTDPEEQYIRKTSPQFVENYLKKTKQIDDIIAITKNQIDSLVSE